MEEVSYILRPRRGTDPAAHTKITLEEGEKARRFHATVPGYEATPLEELPGLANKLGIARLWVKDESKRFGLNAFKGLGGSYAIARELAKRLGISPEHLDFSSLKTSEVGKSWGC